MRAILEILGWLAVGLGAISLLIGLVESDIKAIFAASALLPAGAFLLIVAKLFTYLESLLENLSETKELQRKQLTRLTLNSTLLKIIVSENHPTEYAQMVLDEEIFSKAAKLAAKRMLQAEE